MNDAYGEKAEREYQYFQDLDSALTAYAALPNHLEKEIGMESPEQPLSRMPLIHCINGIDKLQGVEGASLSGKWINQESKEALRIAQIYLDSHDTEIAYQLNNGYLFIQTVSEGYDYTYYDKGFHELDGGLLANTDISMEEAIEEVKTGMLGISSPIGNVINAEGLLENVQTAEAAREESLNAGQIP